jgi:FMN phosphatase YigB (HAD superfamily)
MPGKRDPNRNIAIFDGDNTLWDTNAVFTEAQKNILRGLKEAGFEADPEGDFAPLRKVDDLLIKYFGKREYDITHLPLCLMRHFKGEPVEDVNQVAKIVANSKAAELTLAKTLGAEFNASLKRLPNLFPDVIESLSSIRHAGRTVMVLYSEGLEARLKRICDHYDMSIYFYDIVLGDKSLEDWAETKNKAIKIFKRVFPRARKQPGIYVIGDLLERDIRPGNLIGAKTIYKPGGYKGVETPQDKEHTPAMTVSSMKEVVDLLL